MISLSLNGNLNYFDPTGAASLEPVRVVQGHQSGLSAMLIDRANGTLYTGSNDGVVCSTPLSTGVTQRIKGVYIYMFVYMYT
jgi:hypothetical protein